ncbi:MAG: hypothetical protein DSY90_01410 [Deltaproteobacteria bacterium]|nr:MAG: hypothetical protein DSY90_01410 [Deltaproteobacteria bacterium]
MPNSISIADDVSSFRGYFLILFYDFIKAARTCKIESGFMMINGGMERSASFQVTRISSLIKDMLCRRLKTISDV